MPISPQKQIKAAIKPKLNPQTIVQDARQQQMEQDLFSPKTKKLIKVVKEPKRKFESSQSTNSNSHRSMES